MDLVVGRCRTDPRLLGIVHRRECVRADQEQAWIQPRRGVGPLRRPRATTHSDALLGHEMIDELAFFGKGHDWARPAHCKESRSSLGAREVGVIGASITFGQRAANDCVTNRSGWANSRPDCASRDCRCRNDDDMTLVETADFAVDPPPADTPSRQRRATCHRVAARRTPHTQSRPIDLTTRADRKGLGSRRRQHQLCARVHGHDPPKPGASDLSERGAVPGRVRAR